MMLSDNHLAFTTLMEDGRAAADSTLTRWGRGVGRGAACGMLVHRHTHCWT